MPTPAAAAKRFKIDSVCSNNYILLCSTGTIAATPPLGIIPPLFGKHFAFAWFAFLFRRRQLSSNSIYIGQNASEGRAQGPMSRNELVNWMSHPPEGLGFGQGVEDGAGPGTAAVPEKLGVLRCQRPMSDIFGSNEFHCRKNRGIIFKPFCNVLRIIIKY